MIRNTARHIPASFNSFFLTGFLLGCFCLWTIMQASTIAIKKMKGKKQNIKNINILSSYRQEDAIAL